MPRVVADDVRYVGAVPERADTTYVLATTAAVTRAALVVVASFALGAVTSYAQEFLPSAVRSFANSPSGWTVLTALLVFWSRLPAWPAAVLGAASFVLLVLGYTAAAELRGYVYDPFLFSVVGVIAGPFVGAAASWLRGTRIRASLGTALLVGIGLGDAVYGMTVVRETTHPVYWVGIGLASVALLVGMFARRIRGVTLIATALAGTAAVGTVFILAYRALGYIGAA